MTSRVYAVAPGVSSEATTVRAATVAHRGPYYDYSLPSPSSSSAACFAATADEEEGEGKE